MNKKKWRKMLLAAIVLKKPKKVAYMYLKITREPVYVEVDPLSPRRVTVDDFTDCDCVSFLDSTG
jgi:hypothetical protein